MAARQKKKEIVIEGSLADIQELMYEEILVELLKYLNKRD